MKKKMIFGMASIVAMTSFSVALATTVDIRDGKDKNATHVENHAQVKASEANIRLAKSISDLTKGKVRESDLTAALSRTLNVNGKSIQVADIAKSLLKKSDEIRTNRNELITKEGKERIEALENSIPDMVEFLALLGNTSETGMGKNSLDATTQHHVNALNKQASVIADMLSSGYTDKEINSHVAIMKSANAEKRSSNELGEDVFYRGLVKATGSTKAADDREKKVEDCT